MLGKRRCLRCGQPLSVDLDHRVSELVSRADRLLSVFNIMLCQHLGVAPEEGAYSRDKMSDPAYKPPLRFRLALRLQNGGCICGTLRYMNSAVCWVLSLVCGKTLFQLQPLDRTLATTGNAQSLLLCCWHSMKEISLTLGNMAEHVPVQEDHGETGVLTLEQVCLRTDTCG